MEIEDIIQQFNIQDEKAPMQFIHYKEGKAEENNEEGGEGQR